MAKKLSPVFISCPATEDVELQAPSSLPRLCSYCGTTVIASPNMISVEKREEDVIFLCRSDTCLKEAIMVAEAAGRPIKPQLGRDFYRSQYDEYPPA